MDWILENKAWLFSGIAVAIPIAWLSWRFARKGSGRSLRQKGGKGSTNIQIGGNANIGSAEFEQETHD